ncbi:hypothetical protein Bbelb_021090 [Branchiostoma belcheri]|nr:hypothetical protein Bbelb_021090 [Branchiostoma belcheri]
MVLKTDNYGDSGGEFFYGDGGGRGGSDGAQNCSNYCNSGDKDSGGDRGGRGNSDNPRRDEGVDADWKAITTVVVVAMVADAALNCDNYGDSGGNISYGDGGGRGGMGNLGRNEGVNAYNEAVTTVVVVAMEVIVLKTVAITAKVFTAIAVVAAVAITQDSTSSRAAKCDGAEDCSNLRLIGGEVPYGDGGGRDGIAIPGRHNSGDFALETITAAVVVTIVADDFIEAKTSVITATAAATFLTAMEVVTAVAIAMTPDSTRGPIMRTTLANLAKFGKTAVAKVFTTTAVVSARAIIQDATRAAIGCESSYDDNDGRGNGDNPGRNGCDATEHCGNYGNSGGNISYGDGVGRDGLGDLRRNEGGNAYYKAITTLVVVATDAMGAEDSVNYGESSEEGSLGDRGGHTSSYDPGRNGGGDVDWKTITSEVIGTMEVMVLKDVAITAKVFTAIAMVAAVAITQDSTRAAKSP